MQKLPENCKNAIKFNKGLNEENAHKCLNLR